MSQDVINIKGTRDGLVILVNPAYDFELIKSKLHDKISSAKGFFSGAKFALQSSPQYTPEENEQLTEICCQNGLVLDKNIEYRPQDSNKINLENQASQREILSPKGLLPQELEQNCLLLQKNLRNGQVVNYDGHVTILGDVHAGAQITASGNIIVMGTLKGVAHAGATGNSKAVIMAYSLLPTQLRIADAIARAPEHQKQSNILPEIAYLADNQIVIEDYTKTLPLIS